MDYSLKRERRRILEDLIDLQREEEDSPRSYRSRRKEMEGSNDESDDEIEYPNNNRHRQKKFCLVKLTYRNPSKRQRTNIDEIIISRHNRVLFKACIQDGEQLTFKLPRSRNDERLKLKFYINGVLEEQMISCCENGLFNKYQHNLFFRVERISNAKPCEECESDDDGRTLERTSSPVLHQPIRQDSRTKTASPPIRTQTSTNRSEEQKPSEKRSTLTVSESQNNKASSEGFPANITELSEFNTTFTSRFDKKPETDEESTTDTVSSIPQPTSKRKYGPPQLSTMLSRTDSVDLPTPNIRESTFENLFNSSANTQQRTATLTNSNLAHSMSQSDRYLSRQSSVLEPTQTEQTTSLSLNSSNNIAIANDATQLLLARLGIVRQEQVERPETSNVNLVREKGNVEYFTLVYLHETDPDELIIKHLRSLVNFIKIFDDPDDCVAFINTVTYEKIIFVLSNTFQNSILQRIEDLQQIYTIYILTETNQRDDLIPEESKIQGFYTDINDIYNSIENDINKISRDLVLYLNASSNAITMEPSVVYYLLLSEIMLDKTETKTDIKTLISFARDEYEGNDEELKIIDEFENTYKKTDAIYWYSRPCFISKMINKALRVPEPDTLFRLRLFIQDLYEQIKIESTTKSLTVYLAQTVRRNELDNMQKGILTDDMIIFPQFLYGTTDLSRAIQIAKEIPLVEENSIPIIIQVEIPEDIQCANLTSQRYSPDENNNVLLNVGIMGRLIKIEKENNNENRIATIYMKLIKSENQRNIQQILETTRTEIKSFSPFVTMIKLMMQMKQQTIAEQLIEKLFNDETLKSDGSFQGSLAASCHILAQTRRNQEDYQRALDLYLISLETFKRFVSPKALNYVHYIVILVQCIFEKYENSLEYYQKALEIQLHSPTPDLYALSSYTNSIGIIYAKQGKYPEAIKSYERTLKVLEQCSEPHDAEMASTYDDIGDTYILQLKFPEALTNYKKSLEIQERLIPRNYQTLATSYHTVGNIYLKLGESKQALTHLKQAIEYFQQVLPLAHPTFALLYNNTGLMYYREEDYDESLKYYSKALEIAAISLPENHTLVGTTLFNVGLVLTSQEKYDEAIEAIEKSTKQFLKTLPPEHPDVVENNKYIESLQQKKVLKNIFNDTTTNF